MGFMRDIETTGSTRIALAASSGKNSKLEIFDCAVSAASIDKVERSGRRNEKKRGSVAETKKSGVIQGKTNRV